MYWGWGVWCPVCIFWGLWGLWGWGGWGICIVPYIYIFGVAVSGDIKSPLRLVFLGIYVVPCMYMFGFVSGIFGGVIYLISYVYIFRVAGREWIVREIYPHIYTCPAKRSCRGDFISPFLQLLKCENKGNS